MSVSLAKFHYQLKFIGLWFVYSLSIIISINLAYQLRFDFEIPANFQNESWQVLIWLLPLRIVCLYYFGQMTGILRFFSMHDLTRLFAAIVIPSLLMSFIWLIDDFPFNPPRSIIAGEFLLNCFFIGGFRIGVRYVYENQFRNKDKLANLSRTGIIGAGNTGAMLLKEMRGTLKDKMFPVVFIDDAVDKIGMSLEGVRVVGPIKNLSKIIKDFELDTLLIAMPSADHSKIKFITQIGNQKKVDVKIVPRMGAVATGTISLNSVRNVEIEDLLNRDSVVIEDLHIDDLIHGKTVLVTGAGGSIGSELCRQILCHHPEKLVIVDQCEVLLFTIEQEFKNYNLTNVHAIVADVCDEAHMKRVFKEHSPDLVYHAAAHKHVPLMEAQPQEAIKNNAWGTYLLGKISSEFKVERFTLVSTDKAINPTSAMGASKRLAELMIKTLYNLDGNQTIYAAVRFGNVLGSSGSVIPTFRKQIAEGGPVTVTHPDMTRYFMTIPEAVSLVIQASYYAEGNDIFVLDMGQPVKIYDLARQMIHLSGLTEEDIKIVFTGLRPGEKMYEEIQHEGEAFVPTGHSKIFRFQDAKSIIPSDFVENVRSLLPEYNNELRGRDVKQKVKEFIPEYTPFQRMKA